MCIVSQFIHCVANLYRTNRRCATTVGNIDDVVATTKTSTMLQHLRDESNDVDVTTDDTTIGEVDVTSAN